MLAVMVGSLAIHKASLV